MVLSRAVPYALTAFLSFAVAAPAWAACAHPRTIVQADVVSDPLVVKEDYTSGELRALAGSTTQKPPHPILGFYVASTGYQSTVVYRPGSACSELDVDVRLVSAKRIIEIAKDLESTPCMMKAALKHYRLHEAAQTAGLLDSGDRLQTALQAFLDRNHSAGKEATEALVAGFMVKWLDAYEAGLPATRDRVDSPANVSALIHACDL